jgi:hypothetical protein
MEVSSLAHCEIALSPQAAYGDNQTGAFENFHQLVEDTLIVLRPGPKIFFQNELRFVNCLKSQLLIGRHLFLPIKIVDQSPLVAPRNIAWINKEREIKSILGNKPHFLTWLIKFCFNAGALNAR